MFAVTSIDEYLLSLTNILCAHILNMGSNLLAGNFWINECLLVLITDHWVGWVILVGIIICIPPSNISPDAASEHAALHRQRSLPHRPPIIPLVARMADQNTSGTLAMTEREASRLDKFKQLLAGPNTDLGKEACAPILPLIYLSELVVWNASTPLSEFLSFSCFFLFFFNVACSLSCFGFLNSVASNFVSQLCCVLTTLKEGESPSHLDMLIIRERKNHKQQHKQVTGLCSKQATDLYC